MPQNIEQNLKHTVARSTNPSPIMQSLWESDISWEKVEKYVKHMQEQIYHHTTNKQWPRVKNLQKLLAKSYYAKLLAIREVTQRNQGKLTPGVDNQIYETPEKRWNLSKQSFNYLYDKPFALKRVFIPKQNGDKRPLGIPTIRDRIMQMIVKYVLEPEWEAKFEPNSYGFRPKRQTMDAIYQIRILIGRRNGYKWILDADISKCFDKISHKYLLNQVPTFKVIIRKWLKAGVIEFGKFNKTEEGTPQGGIISPLLANIALHGMENLFKANSDINLVRYADDFVVMAKSKEILEDYVLPKLKSFLNDRKLDLNTAKTKIVHRNEGFTFLGVELRYLEKLKSSESFLQAKPPKSKISLMLRKIKAIFRTLLHRTLSEVIVEANHTIRGWTYYYRYTNAKRTYNYVNNRIFRIIWNSLKRKHPNKSAKWLVKTYYKTVDNKNWILYSGTFKLFEPPLVHILRFIKVRGNISPFDRTAKSYWKERLLINA